MSLLFVQRFRLFQRRFVPVLVATAATMLAAACKDPSPTTGKLIVTIDGLPAATTASVRVTGPNAFFQRLTATTTLENLEPGTYVARTDPVLVSGIRYGAVLNAVPVPVDSTAIDTIAITRGRTETKAVAYGIASGALSLTIDGLPAGIAANLRLIGPLPATNFVTVTTAGTIQPLKPGQYAIQSDTTLSGEGDRFATAKFKDTVAVAASLTPTQAVVQFALASGSLGLTVSGLPLAPNPASVTVTGPGGYTATVGQSVTLRGLSAGTYTVTAVKVNGVCPTVYTASAVQQTKDISIGVTAPAAVNYVEGQVVPAELNLRIDGVHLTQAVQNYAGTVPMLAGRDALLRVFGVANQCNSPAAKVRVTVSGGQPIVINAPEPTVRTSADQGILQSSWNVTIPGALVQVGMTVIAEIDHDNAVVEANEADNRFPATNTRNVDVRPMPLVGLRLVPVIQSGNTTLIPQISPSNVDAFMEWPRKLHPTSYDVEIRAPYTTTTNQVLQAQATSAWTTVLSEINALRLPDKDNSNRHYYGVVNVSYTSGIAGIAFIGGKAGIGWDYPNDASASLVLAHELGHNYNRLHSPCNNPGGVDPAYPSTGFYAGGKIGVYGYDAVQQVLKSPLVYSDIMGYCNTQWISDYTYLEMLIWIITANGTTLPMTVSSAEQPSLLIWGRIENGEPVLEPAFEISARPQLPTMAGPHRITALDAAGGELFSLAFAGERIADLPGENESFAFAVPLSALRGRTLAQLRLNARGKTSRNVLSSDVAADPRLTVSRAGPRAARVRWDAARFPVVMVRDPVSGEVLSFARGGDATIATDRAELEFNFSNRVRSSRRLQAVRD